MITGPVKFDFKTGNIPRQAMAFWCVMIPRTLFDEIGLLDEVFSPGTGEDGDFSIRAQLAGHELVQVPNDHTHMFGTGFNTSPFMIAHYGSATFGHMQVDHIIKRNKAILDKRYGNRLEEAYDWCLHHPCDINGHFPTIRRYARLCEHITEFGTRGVFSTYALMAGYPKKLLTYDIEVNDNIWLAADIAKEQNIEFGFMERDTRGCDIEPTDLLLIDTLHTYSQLLIELTRHAIKVSTYILLHDTETFGKRGEDGGLGLLDALQSFFETQEGSKWQVKEVFSHNNGLTVLERKQPLKGTAHDDQVQHSNTDVQPL